MLKIKADRSTRAALAAGVLLSAALVASSCAHPTTSTSPDSSKSMFDLANLNLKPETAIPETSVRLGIEPFADHAIQVVALKQGWYKDVGIDIKPQPLGEVVAPDQVVARLTQNDLDAVTWYTPTAMQSLVAAPNLRIIAFHDVVLGRYILANPALHVPSVADLVKQGTSFKAAVAKVMQGLKGRTLALGSDPSQVAYLNLLLGYAGLKKQEINIKPLDDNAQVALAKGGKVDYASPLGLAQMAAILQLGWKPVVRLDDFITALGAADPSVRSSIGNTGVAVNKAFLQKNPEAALRLASVVFRIIDQIQNQPAAAYSQLTPYLKSIAGVDLGPGAIAEVFRNLDPLLNFNEQRQVWNKGGRYYYADIYNAVIKDNVKAGVLLKNGNYSAAKTIVGGDVYNALVKLKAKCDQLIPKMKNVHGSKVKSAERSRQLYKAYDYLDAYRFMQAAIS